MFVAGCFHIKVLMLIKLKGIIVQYFFFLADMTNVPSGFTPCEYPFLDNVQAQVEAQTLGLLVVI